MTKLAMVRTILISMSLALFAVLLSSCQGDSRYTAVGLEGGGEEIIPPNIAKMWSETYSEQEWLALLRQRIHQPIAVWHGIRSGTVHEHGMSLGFTGLVFKDSQSHLLEHQLRGGLMRKQPLMFLALFNDGDPEVVLTGVAAYQKGLTEFLGKEISDLISEAFRTKLLNHYDVRVRCAAVDTLAQNGWLTVEDIKKGLNDETETVRIITAFRMGIATYKWNKSVAREHQKLLAPASRIALEEMIVQYASLAPILLDHINDTHPYVRQSTAGEFRGLFTRLTKLDNSRFSIHTCDDLPEKLNWAHADWHTRQATQQVWKQWWEENGYTTLRRAHLAVYNVAPKNAEG